MSVSIEPTSAERLWTRQFIQICAGGFLSYASNTPIFPLVALWTVHLGGSVTTVGLVSAAFSAPSFLLRPFIGNLCDRWNARGVFAAGCVLSAIGSLLIVIPSMQVLFLAQFLNGIGWAGLNTGSYTLVAEIAPPNRRGAASSYLQLCRTSLGFYLPFLGLKLKSWVGFWLPFLLTAIAGLFAALSVIGLKEPRTGRPTSPVIARSRRTGIPVITETIAVTMATPAEGPSFGVAPSGTCTWMSRMSNKVGLMPKATARVRT